MHFHLLNINNSMYILQLRKMTFSPIQNIVVICKQISLLIFYKVSSRLVTPYFLYLLPCFASCHWISVYQTLSFFIYLLAVSGKWDIKYTWLLSPVHQNVMELCVFPSGYVQWTYGCCNVGKMYFRHLNFWMRQSLLLQLHYHYYFHVNSHSQKLVWKVFPNTFGIEISQQNYRIHVTFPRKSCANIPCPCSISLSHAVGHVK